jgi:uncharacterized protein YegL
MTDTNKTALLLIVDRSGSMNGVNGELRVETENSINTYLDDQRKEPGELLVQIVDFDTEISTQVELTNVDNVSRYKLDPRGWTALHDAMAFGIVDLGSRLAALSEDERPGRVIVVTVTDGFENASQEHTADSVKELVTHQTDKYGWDFVFLGANQDAVLTAQNLGIRTGSSLTYDPGNIAVASASLSAYTTQYRGKGSASYTDADRQAAVDSNS